MNYKSKLKRRKIYYVPGLISLVFLPLLFLKLSYREAYLNVIKYYSPRHATNNFERTHNSFTGEYFLYSIRKKKLIQFYLDGNHELNKKKFEVIRYEALKLKFTCDTNHMIAIHLPNEINYSEFVYLLNMMIVDEHKRYVEWENIFYIFGEEPPDLEHEIQPINM